MGERQSAATVSPRDPRALAKAIEVTTSSWRAERRAARVRRRATLLHWLEDSLFGYRMPPAARLISEAEWRRDSVDAFCWRCGATRAPFEDLQRGCAECRDRRLSPRGLTFHGVVRLGRYAPPLSQWVPAVKQRAWREMGIILGRELGHQVAEAIASGRIARPDAVVPVPVHWTRRLLRGIDHTSTLADEVARVIGVPVAQPLRARLAGRQTGASRDSRVGNRGRFLLRGAALPEGCKEVLLVDDVRTTGGTSLDAIRALRGLGVKGASVAVCAVADPPRRSAAGFGRPSGAGGAFGKRENVDSF